jgi:hypothetical protein
VEYEELDRREGRRTIRIKPLIQRAEEITKVVSIRFAANIPRAARLRERGNSHGI